MSHSYFVEYCASQEKEIVARPLEQLTTEAGPYLAGAGGGDVDRVRRDPW